MLLGLDPSLGGGGGCFSSLPRLTLNYHKIATFLYVAAMSPPYNPSKINQGCNPTAEDSCTWHSVLSLSYSCSISTKLDLATVN
jgi:hypothetical protein